MSQFLTQSADVSHAAMLSVNFNVKAEVTISVASHIRARTKVVGLITSRLFNSIHLLFLQTVSAKRRVESIYALTKNVILQSAETSAGPKRDLVSVQYARTTRD